MDNELKKNIIIIKGPQINKYKELVCHMDNKHWQVSNESIIVNGTEVCEEILKGRIERILNQGFCSPDQYCREIRIADFCNYTKKKLSLIKKIWLLIKKMY